MQLTSCSCAKTNRFGLISNDVYILLMAHRIVGLFSESMKRCATAAFTRVELFICLATLTLLALVVCPVKARQRTLATHTENLVCRANLRAIGRAFQLWASDHNDINP